MKKFVVCVCDERYSKIEKQVIGVEMKKIVIYARYSSDRQTEHRSRGNFELATSMQSAMIMWLFTSI